VPGTLLEMVKQSAGAEISRNNAHSVHRYPYLSSSQAGVALLETVKQAKLPDIGARLTRGLSSGAGWDTPTLLLTGDADKYLKPEAAEQVAAANPGVISSKTIEAAGHQPQVLLLDAASRISTSCMEVVLDNLGVTSSRQRTIEAADLQPYGYPPRCCRDASKRALDVLPGHAHHCKFCTSIVRTTPNKRAGANAVTHCPAHLRCTAQEIEPARALTHLQIVLVLQEDYPQLVVQALTAFLR